MAKKTALVLICLVVLLLGGTLYYAIGNKTANSILVKDALATARDPHTHEGRLTVCFNIVDKACDS
jgi:hypothetical protein